VRRLGAAESLGSKPGLASIVGHMAREPAGPARNVHTACQNEGAAPRANGAGEEGEGGTMNWRGSASGRANSWVLAARGGKRSSVLLPSCCHSHRFSVERAAPRVREYV
jgi:hypothetical protein